MKNTILILIMCVMCTQANAQGGFASYLTATFLNKNVYKTKSDLQIQKVYENDSRVTTDTLKYKITPISPGFVRYKVVGEDVNGNKYIKVLPGCKFDDGKIKIGDPDDNAEAPNDYVFMVEKKNLSANTHYLASSALVGKVITMPLRIRNEYFNQDNKILQGSLSLAYGFGWKYKLGNHPYRQHYFNTILYAAGISQQKHFSVTGINADGTTALSAKTDEIAITYLSFGLGYEYDKFNIGIFAGKDKMFGKLKNWVYQDRWWFGIGVGYEVFK